MNVDIHHAGGEFASSPGYTQRVVAKKAYEDEEWIITSSGIAMPFHVARKRRRPIAIDLFCGCGGFSLGFIQAGFHVNAGLDNDPFATITYMHNLGAYPCQFHFATAEDARRLEKEVQKAMNLDMKHRSAASEEVKALLPGCGKIKVPLVSGSGWISHYPEHPGVKHFFFGDARKFTGQQILDAIGLERGEVDCVMGSPPCQGFSYAGKRDIADPRNMLVFEFARLILEIQPKTMIFENVPGIVSMVTPAGIPILDAFCRILADGGFGTFNALKNSLLASSGAGAALKNTGNLGKKKRRKKVTTEQAQLSLF